MKRHTTANGHAFRRLGILSVTAAMLWLAGGAASASAASPAPSSALIGTWANINPNTNSLQRLTITRSGAAIAVDAYGACVPTACQWGSVRGALFGPSVSSPTGTTFETHQTFSANGREWSESELIGSLSGKESEAVLTVQEITVFTDGSGRHNYDLTETFRRGSSAAGRRALGALGQVLPSGQPPLASPALAGHWVNTSSPAIDQLHISAWGTTATVRAYGACVPTYCSIGVSRATVLGTNTMSTTGSVLSASFTQSFGAMQMIITLTGPDTLRLELLRTLNDGRSNYAVVEQMTRVYRHCSRGTSAGPRPPATRASVRPEGQATATAALAFTRK